MLNKYEYIKVLTETMQQIKKLAGYTIIIKYGGAAMVNKALKTHVIHDIIFFSHIGLNPVLVHGGGSTINLWLNQLNITPVFKNGVRVTDEKTMQVVEMVLAGKINKELVTMINVSGGSAVGLCGKDGKFVLAKPQNLETMGLVGNIVSINPTIIDLLLSKKYIPVIASIAYDMLGQSYNINADTLASQLAVALSAEKLVFLTDTPGILANINDPETLIKSLNIGQAKQLEKEGIISGGMIPKVHSCIYSLQNGVASAHIINGQEPHSLLFALLTDQGSGSTLTNC